VSARRRDSASAAAAAFAAAFAAVLASGCVSKEVPMRRYRVAPEPMLEAAAEAARRMTGVGGRPVKRVSLSRHYGEVVAKEDDPEAPKDPGYSEEWRSAGVVTVHAVPADPGASDVEIHGTARSPLLGCAIDWEAMLPARIDEVLRERGLTTPGR
jgi:hypothetical protein